MKRGWLLHACVQLLLLCEWCRDWSAKFGGDGGFSDKSWRGLEDTCLVGMEGTSSDYIDSIGFKFGKVSGLVDTIKAKLTLTWSCQGGSAGTYVVKTFKGSVKNVSMSSSLKLEINATIEASVGGLSAKLGASFTQQLEASMTDAIEERQEQTLTVDLSRPCYVYQMMLSAPTSSHGVISFLGGMVICKGPMH